ncbi:hypothetical protein NQ314_020158 [Rhamnusium bicolor]|uniref:Uncharacterized protein n=1 Tax=Rhamnusium bicolor TaxID=1586634 RepID=A0AAV8WLI2_9CUCU|nr:hypothetical protein NQ314_020158 [Rhamnusium bicolor]
MQKQHITLWLKVGVIKYLSFLGSNVLIYGNGCFIKFVNINTGEEQRFVANRHCVNGDGIRDIRGHRSVNTFAYTENCRGAALHVKDYPSFKTVVTFTSEKIPIYHTLKSGCIII